MVGMEALKASFGSPQALQATSGGSFWQRAHRSLDMLTNNLKVWTREKGRSGWSVEVGTWFMIWDKGWARW